MNILFVHQNFPGQFKKLAPFLAQDDKNRVVAISNKKQFDDKYIENYPYSIKTNKNLIPHPLLIEEHSKILRAESVLMVAKKLRQNGFRPDVIYIHPGWGEGLFLRDIWPDAYMIGYFEYFYQNSNQDFGFDPEFPIMEKQQYLLRLKNNTNYQALAAVDIGISPTNWQRSTYPDWAQEKISCVHDGIDTTICKPDTEQSVKFSKSQLCLTKKDQVVTFVARNLEPLRGFYIFMRALPVLLEKHPKAHFLILGNDNIGYGAKLPAGQSHKKNMLAEVRRRLDPGRIHFLGQVPYSEYLKILQISTVHFYASYPFVVSWSLLEAMSCGCAIVASGCEPVNEFIKDKENGLLFDFFDQRALIKKINKLLEDKKLRKKLAKQARKTIEENYNLNDCLAGQVALIKLGYNQKIQKKEELL